MSMSQKVTPIRPDLDAELNNLAMSKAAQPLFDAVKKHIAENVEPIAEEFNRLGEERTDRWTWAPGQLELLETVKDARQRGGDLRLASVQPDVRRVLELAGFTSILKLYAGVDEAAASFPGESA